MEKREQDLLYKIEVGSENVVVPDSLKPENMKKNWNSVRGKNAGEKDADSGSSRVRQQPVLYWWQESQYTRIGREW